MHLEKVSKLTFDRSHVCLPRLIMLPVCSGFAMIFPVSDLNVFSAAELVLLFGNPEEDWSRSSKFSSDSVTTLPKSNLTLYLASAGTGD
jgi:hypothetical protein